MAKAYFLGYDLGSSSVKAALMDAETGSVVASANYPESEMEILSPQKGWAEQAPETWWENSCRVTRQLLQRSHISPSDILAIGLAYQMHGLVVVDKNQQALRNSIIWCDSRAVETGEKAFRELGKEYCLGHLLNSPGNFTASKLRWVKENEPGVYEKIHKWMLPGDYLLMKMTGEVSTTEGGLSEAILWDYLKQDLAAELLDYYGIETSLTPEVRHNFSVQGELSRQAAEELGLIAGTKITYRAGDQPNNAFSLNVLQPGETAATAGTSGVIYVVSDQALTDPASRINTFVHVNHQKDSLQRYGVLLCINGTGSMNRWLRDQMTLNGQKWSYEEMNLRASVVPIGSDGLLVLPFGNGAERILNNRQTGAGFYQLELNRHTQAHLFRAVQEGIVFALTYGLQICQAIGPESRVVRAGQANLFLSPLFCEAFVNTLGVELELYHTDGAQGAARAAGVGMGWYKDFSEAFEHLQCIRAISPEKNKSERYREAYLEWEKLLRKILD